ncbi:MAG: PAS domain S-box protein [Methanoregula sp.]|jgi:PAS domain S-box-containing protein|nr:PAS domain S-box protein [Methanoregula sp.]
MMQDYLHEISRIKDILKQNVEGMSVTDISKALNKNKNTIGRYLDILLVSGQVDMRSYGMAKVFTLSQRVPLSAMLSYSKELIMVLDNESRIIDVNDNFLSLLNLTRQDTLGKNIEFLSPPDVDVHELLETLTTRFEEKEDTVTFQVKDQGERIFKQKSVPTVFEDGGKGFTLILEDITEHILAEREIRENEERFRMMAENIQDGLIIIENEKIVFVNRRIAEITGYSFEELWEMNPLSIIAPEDKKATASQIQKMERGDHGLKGLQLWILRKDGQRRFVSTRISAVQHADTHYAFIILTDITELKANEAALKESEERFRMMAENIQDGLIIMENRNFVFANHRIADISGYSTEELIHMKSVDLASREDHEKIEEIVRNTRPDSEKPGEFTVWINRKDGSRRCILGRVTAALHNNTVSTYVIMSDITESTEREQALRDRIAALQKFIG